MVEDILDPVVNGESKYFMLSLAAKRVKRLMDGERPAVDSKPGEDVTVTAINELKTRKLKVVPRKKGGKVIDIAKS
jgi:DNA-directed RNA polymerase subunit K/omega